VSAMQRLIITSIASQGGSGIEAGAEAGVGGAGLGGLGGGGFGNLFNPTALEKAAEPGLFILILGIYVLEVVILLSYFNAQIEDTDNELHNYTSIAKNIPMAVILYCATVYLASSFFG